MSPSCTPLFPSAAPCTHAPARAPPPTVRCTGGAEAAPRYSSSDRTGALSHVSTRYSLDEASPPRAQTPPPWDRAAPPPASSIAPGTSKRMLTHAPREQGRLCPCAGSVDGPRKSALTSGYTQVSPTRHRADPPNRESVGTVTLQRARSGLTTPSDLRNVLPCAQENGKTERPEGQPGKPELKAHSRSLQNSIRCRSHRTELTRRTGTC